MIKVISFLWNLNFKSYLKKVVLLTYGNCAKVTLNGVKLGF